MQWEKSVSNNSQGSPHAVLTEKWQHGITIPQSAPWSYVFLVAVMGAPCILSTQDGISADSWLTHPGPEGESMQIWTLSLHMDIGKVQQKMFSKSLESWHEAVPHKTWKCRPQRTLNETSAVIKFLSPTGTRGDLCEPAKLQPAFPCNIKNTSWNGRVWSIMRRG